MAVDEIVLPETKPETEWILGKPVRKVSPTRRHSVLQKKIMFALEEWGADRAQIGAEWRFRMAPQGEPLRPLVPDVALVWNERFRGFTLEEADAPAFAPNVAIEVLSEEDRAVELRHKIDVYMTCGCELVIVVDPFARLASLIDSAGERIVRDGETIAHRALPGFTLDVTDLFASIALPA